MTASDDDDGIVDALVQTASSPPPSPPLGEYLPTARDNELADVEFVAGKLDQGNSSSTISLSNLVRSGDLDALRWTMVEPQTLNQMGVPIFGKTGVKRLESDRGNDEDITCGDPPGQQLRLGRSEEDDETNYYLRSTLIGFSVFGNPILRKWFSHYHILYFRLSTATKQPNSSTADKKHHRGYN